MVLLIVIIYHVPGLAWATWSERGSTVPACIKVYLMTWIILYRSLRLFLSSWLCMSSYLIWSITWLYTFSSVIRCGFLTQCFRHAIFATVLLFFLHWLLLLHALLGLICAFRAPWQLILLFNESFLGESRIIKELHEFSLTLTLLLTLWFKLTELILTEHHAKWIVNLIILKLLT